MINVSVAPDDIPGWSSHTITSAEPSDSPAWRLARNSDKTRFSGALTMLRNGLRLDGHEIRWAPRAAWHALHVAAFAREQLVAASALTAQWFDGSSSWQRRTRRHLRRSVNLTNSNSDGRFGLLLTESNIVGSASI